MLFTFNGSFFRSSWCIKGLNNERTFYFSEGKCQDFLQTNQIFLEPRFFTQVFYFCSSCPNDFLFQRKSENAQTCFPYLRHISMLSFLFGLFGDFCKSSPHEASDCCTIQHISCDQFVTMEKNLVLFILKFR